MRSELCIFDLGTGRAECVLQTDRLIEAPNWSPDGSFLLVNGDGRLFRVPLAAPDLLAVDTDGLHQLNNDHGFSPDGTMIAFSDKTATGESCIHTIPVGGGKATRITPDVPSYWHGWSPDGGTLAYTARRNGQYDIFTCPAAGGDETRLSHGFDHADGPDYSADGQWIWFNGERDGAVDLWRVPADGGDARRMTEDDRVNWFPHPSPCGAHVLYLSYPAGTAFHPRDLDVQLCLMPSDGGASQVLLNIFGGQGSINVPCWAPGGGRFAFMRYGRAG